MLFVIILRFVEAVMLKGGEDIYCGIFDNSILRKKTRHKVRSGQYAFINPSYFITMGV